MSAMSSVNADQTVRTFLIKESIRLLAAFEKTLWWSSQIADHGPNRAALEWLSFIAEQAFIKE